MFRIFGDIIRKTANHMKIGLSPFYSAQYRSFIRSKYACVAKVSKPAPLFTCKAVDNGSFKNINLEDYRDKYLVLLFYPLDFSFVCPTELIAFSDRVEEFRELNAEVLGVSVDSHFSHLAWIKTSRKEGGLEGLDIPLASDLTKKMTRDYGVLHDDGTALRGLFIIDKTLIVRHITINDLPIGRSVDEALRVIKAFQFSEERDVVCPANWQPDSPTITPDLKRQ
ncbi:peroxiredoxin-2 [Caerostris darwini]|uniref:thioredoxin-dependent peroxiredoxin n=1 Tax=Caerostris darwini TaxID=1538125 RepID=A0AAV4WSY6_9ARAC|nr:peroxiredoxin-2 [Caerostris darwini]